MGRYEVGKIRAVMDDHSMTGRTVNPNPRGLKEWKIICCWCRNNSIRYCTNTVILR